MIGKSIHQLVSESEELMWIEKQNNAWNLMADQLLNLISLPKFSKRSGVKDGAKIEKLFKAIENLRDNQK